MFEKLASHSLSHQAAEQIRQLILKRRLKPGDRLASERELVAGLGISRGIIREAIRSLQAQGLLEVKPGKGTFVQGVGRDFIAGHASTWVREGRSILGELLEARVVVETELAGQAAGRANRSDLSRLRAAHAAMTESVTAANVSQMAHDDVAFHQAIAHAAHNRVLLDMLASLTEPLLNSRLASLSLPGRPAVVLQRHEAICNAILARDQVAARQAMLLHLQTARDELRDGFPDLFGPEI